MIQIDKNIDPTYAKMSFNGVPMADGTSASKSENFYINKIYLKI